MSQTSGNAANKQNPAYLHIQRYKEKRQIAFSTKLNYFEMKTKQFVEYAMQIKSFSGEYFRFRIESQFVETQNGQTFSVMISFQK